MSSYTRPSLFPTICHVLLILCSVSGVLIQLSFWNSFTKHVLNFTNYYKYFISISELVIINFHESIEIYSMISLKFSSIRMLRHSFIYLSICVLKWTSDMTFVYQLVKWNSVKYLLNLFHRCRNIFGPRKSTDVSISDRKPLLPGAQNVPTIAYKPVSKLFKLLCFNIDRY